MRTLLIYPLFPQTFWSYDKILELIGRKVSLPPLGLITVAAILPEDWEFKLCDRNIREVTEEEWAWAELVIISAMIVQKQDLLKHIQEGKKRGKLVAVGGPYPTSLPHEMIEGGADFLVLDEGEITLPMLVESLKRGETKGVFRATDKPDVTTTPIPRYDLLELDAYESMSVQFSRGCPFQCEFCDIIVLYGRKPRTKCPKQLLKELDYLYNMGWRGNIFMVDDNFIGNKRNVKLFLKELKEWQITHEFPFLFQTEASVDLAKDKELMELMVSCNFDAVFLGIETPNEESLKMSKKFQNTRDCLLDTIDTIIRAGLRPMAGFIIGFDGEEKGAGNRIIEFVENSAIPIAMFGMLHALPNTALWNRLEKENRLIVNGKLDINQSTLMNFIPTRPIEDIAQEYVDAFWKIYDPEVFIDRNYRCHLKLGTNVSKSIKKSKSSNPFELVTWIRLRVLCLVIWRQGLKRKTRWKFWHHLVGIFIHNPKVLVRYLVICALNEHFIEYREIVRDEIRSQVAEFKAQQEVLNMENNKVKETVFL